MDRARRCIGDQNSGCGGRSGVCSFIGKNNSFLEISYILTIVQITNSAPSHASLGKLNGLAQTLSAAGRAVGPFISGGIFTAATKIQPKGEALAFCVFGGIAFIGFLMSFGIRAQKLEADGEDFDDDESTMTDDQSEDTPLLGRR